VSTVAAAEGTVDAEFAVAGLVRLTELTQASVPAAEMSVAYRARQ
jgi:hypothetical protein